jgi:hypothetical protein
MPKTAKFDAAIVTLEGELPCLPTAEDIGWQERYYALKPTSKEFYGDIQAAIRVLEDWPKWESLIEAAQRKINIQAMDEGLWFVAITASEEYLQNALRELHAIIKQAIAEYKGKEKL